MPGTVYELDEAGVALRPVLESLTSWGARFLFPPRPGEKLDPVEAYEALEPYDAVIIGDVDTCRRKIQGLADLGVDRLMCLMQMGPLPHETVLRSIRDAGEILIPEFAKS